MGYTVYPVNPKGGEIEGLKVYCTLAELPPGKLDRVSLICRRRSESKHWTKSRPADAMNFGSILAATAWKLWKKRSRSA